ncbi:Thiamine biosynthesis protein ThiC [Pseudomonas syringae pv. actinidiae]|uniref:Thiamine biosynthesis protein ThiC n=1 Tax=Pseudomonas syringae pv. actinidiae TaxID=103796 RepID=A0AAN4Q6S6_PSESF|nr:Thiamine biosynthesis protein ThiC [Pseudomonas syringae pv. actinidiae]
MSLFRTAIGKRASRRWQETRPTSGRRLCSLYGLPTSLGSPALLSSRV